ncbi:nuclear transport factor 2 family protein [Sinorhizobium sp. BG8]|uniref:nuclear transport factor 2 family protein n=1 Tax=Sinorhizobium sp. BG8 TaxID=2613773 RepID=UPI00193D7DB8|nr:nuclear transport factor 2 family protein [Sinorhizobium sp. BG8]QRM57277.1 nuclear transport factor 2 family protein [Sinorhizobium sp. BG8]
MTDRTKLESVVRTVYRARDENDVETIVANWGPDGTFRIVGNEGMGPITKPVRGVEAVRATLQELLNDWDLADARIVSLHVDENTVYVHRAGRVRFIPSDTWINTDMMDKFTFEGDKIVDFLEFADTMLIAETAGLLTSAAQRQ